MADEQIEQQLETPSETPKRKGRGLFRVVKAVAFVSVIVVVQIVVASMLAPSAKDTERLAKELVAASSGKAAGEEESSHKPEAEAGEEHDLHEVEFRTISAPATWGR